ncbi:MAG: class I SAM-dependent methyltransferase [Chloroflexi bacterium]|nr:class I SAM-dependent methyltransferase [Chloroflexota bacterium]
MNLGEFYDAYWRRADDTFDMERLNLIASRVFPGENVLEVDCGPGVLAKMMQERGAKVTGTDLSMVAVERARAKGIEAYQVDIDTEPLPFAEDTFDTVVSNSMIEHRFFPERSFDECVRVLKPGGKFIVCLPNIAHWICRWWLITGHFPYVEDSPTDMLHLRFFTVSEVKKICRQRGLRVLEVDGSPSLWAKEFYPPLVRSRYVRWVYPWLAHRWPSLFARDFVVVCRREGTSHVA